MSQPQTWTTRSVLQWCSDWLYKRGIESPRLDSELLLAHALAIPRLNLFLDPDRPLDQQELAAFKALIKRRAEREPVAYILGRRDFWTLTLTVRPGVLIPRPETEHLVEAVLAHFPERDAPCNLLELGIGSGAALLALLSECPVATGTGIDVAPAALSCTAENAEKLMLDQRLTLLEGDLYGPLEENSVFEAILSNPPYIREDERPTLAPEINRWEPDEALYAGADGLDLIRRIVAKAHDHLAPHGLLALEIGSEQDKMVTELFKTYDFDKISLIRDLAGHPRVVTGVRS